MDNLDTGGTRWRRWLRHKLKVGKSRVQFPMVSMDFFFDIVLWLH